MYVVKCSVVTRVMEQAMIVMSDILSDCISLIKFFDNYVRVFRVLNSGIRAGWSIRPGRSTMFVP